MLPATQTRSRSEIIEIINLLEEQARREALIKYLTIYKSFYDWQREFVAATARYHECCLCAANQIGKTYLGTDIDAVHLLGDYPDDWEGHKFDFPPLCWGLGYSMEKTRDLLQKALFGDYIDGEFKGGLIPKSRIVPKGWESATGTPNAMRTVKVRHALGISTIQFWSYSQGQHAIMGDVVDWFHVDEEPKDQSIRPQVLTRTINGDKGKGGRGIYTFTPENGRTSLVIQFKDEPSPDQFFMQKGWVHAPHMTKEKRERLLAQYPAHQRDMRSKGEPMLGHGRIYDIGDDYITCAPVDIPDHWYVLDGMDFGDDHPQARIKLVEDRDNGIFYVTRAWKARRVSADDAWGATKAWAAGIPTAWPADGLQGEKARADSTQLKTHYSKAGFKMLAGHATWPPTVNEKGKMVEGGTSVETGLFEINGLMAKGLFRIFLGLHDVLDEVRQYHRNEQGKIAKVNDDLLDAIRYAYMMRRYAIRVGDSTTVKKVKMPQPIRTMGKR